MTFDNEFYKDKIILVTGGAGSIGAALVRKLLDCDVKTIRVLDNNETGLFYLENSLRSDKVRTFVGDIRDPKRLKRSIEDADVVFHAAALKHVPLCEYNPFEAVQTNVVSTQNVIDAAIDEEIEKMILVSTDKAANARNVMGATKLLAERLTISANFYKGNRKTIFSCVRFGNVLASRGSVIPYFENQIARGGPVTVTDPEMTRFIMSLGESIDLVLNAGQIAAEGDIFIFKMASIRIFDLAKAMAEVCALQHGYRPEDIEIRIVGKRPGEKMYEELMTAEEAEHAIDQNTMFVLNEHYPESSATRVESSEYTSSLARQLSMDEIKDLIRGSLKQDSAVF
jgi:UDP-N-acetylglucosamine 4,6-dehydratase/5-epimerase